MIKTLIGQITIEGSKVEILSDVSIIAKGLKESGFSKEEIEKAVELGLKDDAELKAEAHKALNDLFEALVGFKVINPRKDGK